MFPLLTMQVCRNLFNMKIRHIVLNVKFKQELGTTESDEILQICVFSWKDFV